MFILFILLKQLCNASLYKMIKYILQYNTILYVYPFILLKQLCNASLLFYVKLWISFVVQACKVQYIARCNEANCDSVPFHLDPCVCIECASSLHTSMKKYSLHISPNRLLRFLWICFGGSWGGYIFIGNPKKTKIKIIA